MKKRFLSLALSLMLVAGAAPLPTAFAGADNFQKVNTYSQGQFTDVSASAWYAVNVQKAFEYGLVNGKSATKFDPESNLTLGEAVKLAASLHRIYNEGSANFETSSPWYQSYVDYAVQNGIMQAGYSNYDAAASRAQFATLLAAALPDEALPQINDVEDGAIPDVTMTSQYAAAVYKLYRAGVLTGSDAMGRFMPGSSIIRSEVAAIVTRMADKTLRKSVTLINAANTVLTAEQVFAACSPSVFYIEVYDKNGTPYATGSGVFLSASGEAMTNFHVIEDGASAKIKTADGKKYTVSGVYAYNKQIDLARIQVDGSGFTPIVIDTTGNVTAGAKVYAIGSPQGLDNTISDGIISNPKRTLEGMDFIQTTASISHGSSGGALLNTAGQLIGITSATIESGQNLNLAIPVSYFDKLGSGSLKTLAEITGATTPSKPSGTGSYYDGYYPVSDFGVYTGAPIVLKDKRSGIQYYFYDFNRVGKSRDAVIDGYAALLREDGFTYITTQSEDGISLNFYYERDSDFFVGLGVATTSAGKYYVVAITTGDVMGF